MKNNVKWTYETCFELAKKCHTRSEMKLVSNCAYQVARKNGWLNDYIWFNSKDRKPIGYWNNYEHCKEEASKYSNISDFEKNCVTGAKYSRENGWLTDFFEYKTKPSGYWNNYEHCKEMALTCKTIFEFSKKSSAAYSWSRKNNWLETFNWLIDSSIYGGNKVDCVYVYEFDEYNCAYIGRTLIRRLKKRDKEHRTSKYIDKNSNEHYTYDTIAKFSEDNNCIIPPIKILESHLTIDEGRIKEDEYRKKYENDGWLILNKAKTGEFSSSIGSLGKGKWTEKKCKEIALACKSLSEFKRTNGSAYESARTNGWLYEYEWFVDKRVLLSEASKKIERKWTYNECYKLAKQCKTPSEFQSKSSRAYAASRQYGWFEDYTWFVNEFSLIQPYKWTEDKCREIAQTCSTRSEFKSKNNSAYQSARKNGWIHNYDWFEDGRIIGIEKRRIYTYDVCFDIAKKYKTKVEFKNACSGAYHAARVNKWLENYTWFKNGRCHDRKWSFNAIKTEASRFIHKRDFMLNSNVAYRKARDKNYINKIFYNMKFNFKNYFDNSGFNLEINSDINFNDFEYISFSSNESQKKVFNFYKDELQQGNSIKTDNLGKEYIALSGFYDMYPKKPSWNKFKNEICPIILYDYEIDDNGTIILTPLDIRNNNDLFKTKNHKILKL